MRSGRLASWLRVTALVAVLVAAQTATLLHSDLDDSHPVGDVCALCVGLASLGAGNVAAPQHVDVVVQRAGRFEAVLVTRTNRHAERRSARGPPLAS